MICVTRPQAADCAGSAIGTVVQSLHHSSTRMDACRRSSPQNSASGALLDKVASYLVQHLSERMPLRDQASSSRMRSSRRSMFVTRSAHFVAQALLDSRTYAGTEAEADQSAPRSRMSLAMCSRAFAAGDLRPRLLMASRRKRLARYCRRGCGPAPNGRSQELASATGNRIDNFAIAVMARRCGLMVCKPPGAPLPSVLTGLGGRRAKRVMRERKLTLAKADMSGSA